MGRIEWTEYIYNFCLILDKKLGQEIRNLSQTNHQSLILTLHDQESPPDMPQNKLKKKTIGRILKSMADIYLLRNDISVIIYIHNFWSYRMLYIMERNLWNSVRPWEIISGKLYRYMYN